MSKVSDEHVEAATRAFVFAMTPGLTAETYDASNAALTDDERNEAHNAIRAALEAASSTPDGEAVTFDPHRVLKDALFQFVKAGAHEPVSYGGVLVADGEYARIRFDTERLSHNAGEIEAGGEVSRGAETEGVEQSIAELERQIDLYLPGGARDIKGVLRDIAIPALRALLVGQTRDNMYLKSAPAEAADKRIAELEAAIRGLLRSEYESAEPGLTDCIDNTGTPYQSQYLADQIKLAEAALKGSRL